LFISTKISNKIIAILMLKILNSTMDSIKIRIILIILSLFLKTNNKNLLFLL